MSSSAVHSAVGDLMHLNKIPASVDDLARMTKQKRRHGSMPPFLLKEIDYRDLSLSESSVYSRIARMRSFGEG